uniref:Uncharacterized protein n=1 Tax=Fagus sylvatica TaxID=28930 RepID=A0A2N9HAG3_FAGSY
MLWKCFHRSLPVKDVLFCRNIVESPVCDICQEESETILHVLRDCSISRRFWIETGISSRSSLFFDSECLDWLKTNACNHTKLTDKPFTWSNFFLFGIWHLWFQRNKCIFQHINPNPTLHCFVEKMVIEFSYCVLGGFVDRISRHIQIIWEKPASNWSKLNSDGSFVHNIGIAGGGGLIRNSDGDWIMGYARNIGATSSEAAELWALRDGLTLCHQLQLTAVEVELDAKLIVNAITNNSCCHSALSPLIDDCRKLLSQLPQAKVLHCYREANFCADALAKMGTSLEQDFILYPLPPTHVNLLDKDILGLFCNRLCNSLPNI